MAPTRTQPQPARELHNFPRLPKEIQLLIWDFWRQHAPIIRHYFVLHLSGRAYAAFNCETKNWVQTASRTAEPSHDDPLDPMEHKILFTNAINVALPGTLSPAPVSWAHESAHGSVYSHIHQILSGHYFFDRGNTLRPAHASVNFRKDVFFIDNIGYRLPGRMRFLFHRIGARRPRWVENHWAAKIEKLAFYVNGSQQSELNGFWGEIDIEALANMRLLKKVYLVFRCSGCSVEHQHRADSHGFVHDLPNNGMHSPDVGILDEFGNISTLCRMSSAKAQQQKAEMASRFTKAGRHAVEVEVVADVGFV
ncbi:hypothetical protein JX265_002380 [Neoarthrinium moseri]|uniref:Uncharacterized protein n=1 Tax=Neoarthrinium moseri TaxID=1658444 RepID=A0A9P9WUY5_9PEZI|nr:hypothetical protein JX266_000861 [Neoarthrinium moseri]KAI1879426.1 hypothetical protein JX265_002380 [Neoarthrinium moseri]